MPKIGAEYIWRCESCGKSDKRPDKLWLQNKYKDHRCNPVLYNLIRQIETEFKRGDLIINCNGAISDIEEKLGITANLASQILNEMEEKGLATFAIPSFR